jgi:hypothetical protein
MRLYLGLGLAVFVTGDGLPANGPRVNGLHKKNARGEAGVL